MVFLEKNFFLSIGVFKDRFNWDFQFKFLVQLHQFFFFYDLGMFDTVVNLCGYDLKIFLKKKL
jgi:hypothetical protein